MKRMRLEVDCFGCEKKFRVNAAKPGLLSPTRLNSKCPMCESTNIFKFTQSRGTGVKNSKLVDVHVLAFKPSAFFLEALEMADKEAKAASEEKVNVESNNSMDNGVSSNDVVQTGPSE
jgi:hypothetical protein